jgi:hypothetical protein
VQRVFARAGLPVAHYQQAEALFREGTEKYGAPPDIAAFFTDSTKEVEVSLYRKALPGGDGELRFEGNGADHPFVTITRGNVYVKVKYPKRGSQASRVRHALALLRQPRLPSAHATSSRYSQGTDSTGAPYCVVYDRNGAGGDVREGACPKASHP